MRFGFIAPKSFPEISKLGDFRFVLAQDLDDPTYVESLKGKMIYLDNGAHENKFEGVDWFIRQIAKVNPYLVFAPDDLNSRPETERLLDEFLAKTKNRSYKVAAIPHGNDLGQYHLCHNKFVKNKEVDWIGVSYLDPPKYFKKVSMSIARRELLMTLTNADIKKPTHLLGLSDGFYDIRYGRTLEWVRSCDSSGPFMHGYLGHRYESIDLGDKTKTLDPEITTIARDQRANILHNIHFLKNKTSWQS